MGDEESNRRTRERADSKRAFQLARRNMHHPIRKHEEKWKNR